jgi:hypothetical protein
MKYEFFAVAVIAVMMFAYFLGAFAGRCPNHRKCAHIKQQCRSKDVIKLAS